MSKGGCCPVCDERQAKATVRRRRRERDRRLGANVRRMRQRFEQQDTSLGREIVRLIDRGASGRERTQP